MKFSFPTGSTRRAWLAMLASYFLLGTLLLTTNPNHLPLVLLLAPLVLLFVALYLTVRLLLEYFLPNVRRRQRVGAAICLAGVPTFLLLLSSVDQLTWRDVALVCFLMIFLLFYNNRANFLNR